ncbi:MAG: hypothetical protein KTV72_04560, partial [Wolbachia endosymbiont of Melophagus ovinus]|nr:hypothetical protein [Wolbachia endosymbiont of Melophagus ovinus]
GQNKPLPAGADGKLASFAKELKTKVSNAGAKNEEYIAKIEREQKEKREQNASPREALLTAIREGVKLKPVEQKPKEGKTQQPPNTASQDIAQILARRKHIETPDSESESERSDHSDSEDWTDNEGDKQKSSASFNRDSDRSVDGKEPRKKKLKKRSERSIPQTHQPDNKKRSESPDSGCASDDNVQSKPTPPSHSSAPKAGKPQVPPKPANLQARSEASPVKKEYDADPVNGEMQDPSASSVNKPGKVNGLIKLFGG